MLVLKNCAVAILKDLFLGKFLATPTLTLSISMGVSRLNKNRAVIIEVDARRKCMKFNIDYIILEQRCTTSGSWETSGLQWFVMWPMTYCTREKKLVELCKCSRYSDHALAKRDKSFSCFCVPL